MELFKIFGTLALNGVDNVNRQLDDVSGKASGTQDKFTSACKKIGTVVAGAFTTKALIDFGKQMVETAGQSEASFAKVTTLLDTSKVNTDAYYASVKKGANESHVSISDFSEALYQALSASVDAGHAVDFTTKAVELSKAGFTSAATAVDVMTTAINAYGLSADDADHISDNLITTQNLGKTTVDELAASMGKVIPTASAYGVNIDNLCSSYAIMTKSGIATAESTTYLKGMLNELGDSGSDVSAVLKDKTGKSFAECMNSGMSLGDVLQVLSDSVDGNTTEFANLWHSQEAGTGALALVNAGSKEFNSTLNQMQNNAGATASAYEKIEGTMEAKTEALKAKFSNLKSELGEKLIPVVDKVVDALSNKVIPAIEKAGQWIEKHKDQVKALALAITGAVATFAAFKAALAIVSAIKTFVTALSMASSATAFLQGAMTALSASFSITPIGLVITAISALVAAFIYLWNTNEGFRNFWINLWDNIKSVCVTVVNAIKDFLTSAWNAIKSVTTTVFNAVKSVSETVWNGIKSVITTVADAIKSVITSVWNAIKSVTTTVWNAIKSVMTTVVNGIKSVVTSVFNAVKSTVTSIWNGIKSTTTSVWNAVKTAVSTPVNAIRSTVTSVFNSVRSTVSSVFNSIHSTASSVWNSIKSAITRPVEAARDAVGNAIQRMRSFFHFSWSLPHLALPHLSISGHFSINPPSVPHFGISWYKKAMEQPYLFTQPTIFGMNPATGQAKGAGEAGDEMMYGKTNLMNDIRTVVSSEITQSNGEILEIIGRMFDFLQMYIPQIANMQMTIDGDTVVGRLAPAMDEEIGNIIRRKERGANW